MPNMSFFRPAATVAVHQSAADATSYELPNTTDPDIQAFYAQLSERERIAHAIATTKLGTSYDVTRTHGYLKWLKSRASAPKSS